MRTALLAIALALTLPACPGGDTGSTGDQCQTDADCGGLVCARTDECLPASQVREVKTTWMIRSMPASAQNCASSPDFFINFYSPSGEVTGFAPVPCMAGQFNIDKLPRDYDTVEMGVDGVWSESTNVSSMGTATFNLFP